MAKFDMRVVGPSFNKVYDTDANSTDILVGEPVNLYGTYTSGAASANYALALTDGKPVIGTDNFGGIAAENSDHTASVDGTVRVTKVFPFLSEIWGKAKSAAAIDTAAELLAIKGDVVLFDLTSSTYTIDQAAAADTSGLRIEDGNTAKGELGVTVDVRALRNDVS